MNNIDVEALYQVAEVELVYHRKSDPQDLVEISSSEVAYNVLKQAWNSNKIDFVEEFKILLLNRGNKCIGISNISTGGTTSCIADARVVFATALKANAKQIILAHNHPGGNLKPSREDMAVTNQLFQAGKIIDIKVIEHMIIASNGYYSMADNGLVPG